MNNFCILFITLFVSIQTYASSEIAILGEPLSKEYALNGDYYKVFYQTGKMATSYSAVCDMGQAIQNSKQKDWYTNKPIQGLKLELRARAAIIDIDGKVKPIGFVVVTKNKDVLITFSPLGEMVNGKWEGDIFSSWSGVSTDIKVFSGYIGRAGSANFDLLDGNGFFYKTGNTNQPDYFLSNCKRITKNNLPIYNWK
ncbi:hypothetical protein [Pseudoalteromonas sp. SA25]|uniref:hypothetical protein n=1 Tax=Pseudoalteromonas sp. SA25 TaxID=2686347 RepID=UPI0013FD9F16|nr:hypothetical protein [Pseudoalteromonas sp. SA25]